MTNAAPQPASKPQYFEDPATDALYQMVLILAEEVAVLREIVDTGFDLQTRGKPPSVENLASHVPTEDYDETRAAFVRRLLAPVEALMQAEAERR